MIPCHLLIEKIEGGSKHMHPPGKLDLEANRLTILFACWFLLKSANSFHVTRIEERKQDDIRSFCIVLKHTYAFN